MILRRARSSLILVAITSVAALFAACETSPELIQDGGDGDSGDGDSGDGDGLAGSGSGDGDIEIPGGDGDSTPAGTFSVEPKEVQTISVQLGAHTPTVTYEAFLNEKPTSAGWSVDRGEVGSVTLGAATTGVFTPTGLVGGTVVVSAALNTSVVQREIIVNLVGTQNGADPSDPGQAAQIVDPTKPEDLTAGGGPGGVGGDGLGVAVTDADVLSDLETPTGDIGAAELVSVYPYDGTVFPRGMLAPLVAWDWEEGDADAIKMELTNEAGTFTWSGTFGPPAVLATTGKPFVHHPIPQNVWDAASSSAGGKTNRLKFRLTVANGGQGYGPLEQTWTIADARLSGTIYYNSYGTNLAKNHGGAVGGDGLFGGAVLGIRVGDTGPSLVAGESSPVDPENPDAAPDESYCRVCHSVSADGSRLIASKQGPDESFPYTLAADGTITTTTDPIGTLTFPAMYPDGSMALSNSGDLYALPEGTLLDTATGIKDYPGGVGTPMFSADGKKLVINQMSGTNQNLVVFDFEVGVDSFVFSNPVEVVNLSAENADVRPGWPAFLPDGQSIVFHKQLSRTAQSNSNNTGDLYTRRGVRAQIHWASAIASAGVTEMNQLNGLDASGDSYLQPLREDSPIGNCMADGHQVGTIDRRHEGDHEFNYEATVNPVGGGGYAWVVFTSRRRYGNAATIPPFCSDPRGVDLFQNITPKKLWVAAVDLNAEPGTDASHPAFYLPGQELLAGNSRAFWVLDPCRDDGNSCETGDQCCGGFCQPDGETGELVCSNEPPGHTCSEIQEKCETGSDCCDKSLSCLGGFCTQLIPH